ncbi:MAG: aminoacyl-histidine dipeptidase [Clostridia bacterium]|nr:aminoacyl-histidine dipeptidase [Clostridia bacterium]
MYDSKFLKPEKVFSFFGEICKIPHGSGNMKKISDYCVDFAESRGLRYYRDKENNVIIYKGGTAGYENSDPVILQGHLDMVCQKTADSKIDFESDPIEIYTHDNFIKAKNTTLGADNGIAVAMVLSILDSDDLAHPPIEAVFTTDEEIGMIGASALDTSKLKARKMINLDSEEDDVLTVSCAGGEDFSVTAEPEIKAAEGGALTFIIKGLQGGHSGVEIDKGRVNSNILAGRFLLNMKSAFDFDLVSISGGDKGNAIPLRTEFTLVTKDTDAAKSFALNLFDIIKKEISSREPNFALEIYETEHSGKAFSDELRDKLIFILNLVPDGITSMSREIEGLVETSLNLGVLKADEKGIFITHALRSNKATAIFNLADRLAVLYGNVGFEVKVGGFYPPWEFKDDSTLQNLYRDTYKEVTGDDVKVEAIHAGLECAVFADKIEGLDCIAIGPTLFDVHTINERMDITSVEKIYNIVTKLLASLK